MSDCSQHPRPIIEHAIKVINTKVASKIDKAVTAKHPRRQATTAEHPRTKIKRSQRPGTRQEDRPCFWFAFSNSPQVLYLSVLSAIIVTN